MNIYRSFLDTIKKKNLKIKHVSTSKKQNSWKLIEMWKLVAIAGVVLAQRLLQVVSFTNETFAAVRISSQKVYSYPQTVDGNSR